MAQKPSPQPYQPPTLEERVAGLEKDVVKLRLWQHVLIGISMGVTFLLTLIVAIAGVLKR